MRQRGPFLLLLLPTVALSILYWREDVANPLTISALLIERVLQITTALILPGAIILILVAPLPLARGGAVAASVCSCLLGASSAFSALRPPTDPLPTLLALATLILGAGSLTWLTHNILASWRWRFSIIGLVTILPLIQFWHATSFVPANLATSLQVSASVAVKASTQDARRGAIEVKLSNASDRGATILAADVTACFRDSADQLDYRIETLYADRACKTTKILDELSVIDGETTWTFHQSYSASTSRSLVQMVIQVWYARSDRMRVDRKISPAPPETSACAHGHHATYRLLDESKFRGLVQKDRFITFEGKQQAGSFFYYFTVEGESLCAGGNNELGQYLGSNYVRVNYEDWLT